MSSGEARHNVRFIDGNNDVLGGFWQNGSVTWVEVQQYLHIGYLNHFPTYAVFPCTENLQPMEPILNHGARIEMLPSPVVLGYYVLLSPTGDHVDLMVTTDVAPARTISYSLSGVDSRILSFTRRVRQRDRCCVFNGTPIPFDDEITGFTVSHILPLAHLDLWQSGQWASRIEDSHQDIGRTKIHSIQNGILLTAHLHILFDQYKLAVNPDNDYKITCFTRDVFGVDSRKMVMPDCPPDLQPLLGLLKYHYRNAVLCNMKGRGKDYDWDEDIHPGYDHIAEISRSHNGKLRFELDLGNRLNHLIS